MIFILLSSAQDKVARDDGFDGGQNRSSTVIYVWRVILFISLVLLLPCTNPSPREFRHQPNVARATKQETAEEASFLHGQEVVEHLVARGTHLFIKELCRLSLFCAPGEATKPPLKFELGAMQLRIKFHGVEAGSAWIFPDQVPELSGGA